MKKLALALCLLAVSFTAQAQFEKGTMILNPSVTGLDFSYSKNDDAKFGIGAQAGTFLADGFAFNGKYWSRLVATKGYIYIRYRNAMLFQYNGNLSRGWL